ncbi:unnamed protein product [Linum tenue]|uniref:Uncharacterized protein n=1 Tax=Linum tenue TaxID=586396 RepID=A0AAV0I366_9ROSI|nr:unnamed protein product [Linum tenue]
MDLNPHIMRKRLPSPNPSDHTSTSFSSSSSSSVVKRFGSTDGMSVSKLVAALMLALPAIFLLSVVLRRPQFDLGFGFADARVLVNPGDEPIVQKEASGDGNVNEVLRAQLNATLPDKVNRILACFGMV